MNTTIWIDADACPRAVKDIIFKASRRLLVPVKLVANSYMQTPDSDLVELIQVPSGFDVADNHIVANAGQHDVVITADIPLAGELVRKGLIAISPKGEIFDAESIGERLAMRNLFTEMRSSGEIMGGGRPYSEQDKRDFAATFDRTMVKLLRTRP
jgi:uncharacterized protein YaiI (UPF0178 family)